MPVKSDKRRPQYKRSFGNSNKKKTAVLIFETGIFFVSGEFSSTDRFASGSIAARVTGNNSFEKHLAFPPNHSISQSSLIRQTILFRVVTYALLRYSIGYPIKIRYKGIIMFFIVISPSTICNQRAVDNINQTSVVLDVFQSTTRTRVTLNTLKILFF